MKITMNLAEEQTIKKTWLVLQEIQEKLILIQNDDATIDLPEIPSGVYLQEWLKIYGENVDENVIIEARAEVISGLDRREIIDFEEQIYDRIRFTTTEKFDDFCKEIEKKYNNLPKGDYPKITRGLEKRKSLITRDKTNGNFYFKNKLVKFKNKEAIYYLVFECLYEKGDLNGFCSYETINNYLKEHGKEEYTKNQQKMDRIKNGIVNLFRFSNLSLNAPDAEPLIQKVRGKGIKLYNPPI